MPDLARHVSGKKGFAAFFDSWIKLSTLNALDWQLLSEAALGVPKLHQSQISGIRTGVSKHLGVMVIDAIAAVNIASWKFHKKGKQTLKGDLAQKIQFVPPIDVDGDPADVADFTMMYLGLQEIPELPVGWLGQSEPVDETGAQSDSELSKAAGRSIRSVIAAKKFDDPVDGFAAFITHYPTSDKARLRRLREVCFDIDDFSSDELEAELVAICLALKGFTGEKWNIKRLSGPELLVKP